MSSFYALFGDPSHELSVDGEHGRVAENISSCRRRIPYRKAVIRYWTSQKSRDCVGEYSRRKVSFIKESPI